MTVYVSCFVFRMRDLTSLYCSGAHSAVRESHITSGSAQCQWRKFARKNSLGSRGHGGTACGGHRVLTAAIARISLYQSRQPPPVRPAPQDPQEPRGSLAQEPHEPTVRGVGGERLTTSCSCSRERSRVTASRCFSSSWHIASRSRTLLSPPASSVCGGGREPNGGQVASGSVDGTQLASRWRSRW